MWVNSHHHSYFWNTQTAGLVFWFQCQKQVNMGNRCVPFRFHLIILNPRVFYTTHFPEPKDLFMEKWWNMINLCTFETSPNICFSVSSLLCRILDTFQQIEAVADSFAWLKSYSSNNHDFSVDNGIVSLTDGVKFRINHVYGRLLGKVICGQVDKNMAIYGNDDKHSWDAVNRWKTVDRISNKTPSWQLRAARS